MYTVTYRTYPHPKREVEPVVFSLSDSPTKITPADTNINGAIHIISNIMKNVMVSATEAEIGSAYMTGQECVPIRTTLKEMEHPQPSTPIQVENTTAVSFTNGTMKQKGSKSIDMNFYWIQDRTAQGQFQIYWGPGSRNLADYHSKHHSPTHHQEVRHTYLYTEQSTQHLTACFLRGCAKSRYIARGTSIYYTPIYIARGGVRHIVHLRVIIHRKVGLNGLHLYN